MTVLDLAEFGLEHVEVDLDWRRPREVKDNDDAGSCLPEEAREYKGIYRFVRIHHAEVSEKHTTQRVGIAYKQSIATRVSQYGEVDIGRFRSRGRLFLTYALLDFDGAERRKHYESVEHLLCFFQQPLWNERKISSLPNDAWYKITNSGSRGDLPREIHYPALIYKE